MTYAHHITGKYMIVGMTLILRHEKPTDCFYSSWIINIK